MSKLNFKQVVYAGLVAVAGEDEDVTKQEKKRIDAVFDHFIKMSAKDKKEVFDYWKKMNEDEFVQLIITELREFPKNDQLEAWKRIAQYINYTKSQYDKNTKVVMKDGVDVGRIEITKYWEKANFIRDGLDFTAAEYNAFVKGTRR